MKNIITVAIIAAITLLGVGVEANNVRFDSLNGEKSIEVNVENSRTFAYVCMSKGWSEAYVGPTIQINKYAEVGVGAGIESGRENVRFGSFLWASKGKTSVFCVLEEGGSGQWHKVSADYQVAKNLKAGLVEQSNLGFGVSSEVKLTDQYSFRATEFLHGKELKLVFTVAL
ncbi:MAG: hypothetical protein WCI57_04870 [Candidatus Berkelbacteria bacterium]